MKKNKTYEILFIGNSYTFFNATVPTEQAKIAQTAGYSVNVESVTKGAWSLEQFADVVVKTETFLVVPKIEGLATHIADLYGIVN